MRPGTSRIQRNTASRDAARSSPTLAGDDRAASREAVLRWIREVPGLIRRQAPATVGLKLMNALLDESFQVEMLRAAADSGADFLVLFNRLFDAGRGVAYGGWDLSERNLRVLDAYRSGGAPGARRSDPYVVRGSRLPPGAVFSATGNICSGRVMVEYALRGATSGQLHTFFQLPLSEYPATAGSRSARAMHALVFHPDAGLIAWMLSLGESGHLEPRGDGQVLGASHPAADARPSVGPRTPGRRGSVPGRHRSLRGPPTRVVLAANRYPTAGEIRARSRWRRRTRSCSAPPAPRPLMSHNTRSGGSGPWGPRSFGDHAG